MSWWKFHVKTKVERMGDLKNDLGFSRVLVTGATGVAGPALVNLLVEKGYCVRIFSRHCEGFDLFPKGVERFQGDLLDDRALSMALKDVDGVFHLAAKLHDTKGLCHDDEFTLTNVKGTQTLVNMARGAGVKRFIFFSTINVYGNCLKNDCFTETSPVNPQDRYARSKLEAENIVLAGAHNDPGGFAPVVLRMAAVYGKRIKGNYKTLILYLKNGGFLLLGSGVNLRTLIFDKDLAVAALLALEHPGAPGQIYNVTDGYIYSFNEIVFSICDSLGRKTLFLKVPEKLVKLILNLVNRTLCSRRLIQLSRMAEKQMESVAVSGKKLQTELGFLPRYGLDMGWREVVVKES